jgi:hypothetical protein
LVLILFATAQFCQRQTDGFALTKVAFELLEGEEKGFEMPELGQAFHYLCKGGQSYVFLSEDGRYVLKFFRASRLNLLKELAKVLPMQRWKKTIKKGEKGLEKTYRSYQLAASSLPEECGILGIHFHPTTSLPKRLILIDKVKCVHKIDPNKYPFVLQLKATPVKERLKELVNIGDIEGAKQSLRSLFALLEKRVASGIEDKDPNLVKNFGFHKAAAIQIDPGRFEESEVLSSERVAQSKEDLMHWIHKELPELNEEIDQAYEELVHALF